MWISVFINIQLIVLNYRKMFDWYFFIDDSYIYQLDVCVCVYQLYIYIYIYSYNYIYIFKM